MTNKQYDTSKFEEALKDLNRWELFDSLLDKKNVMNDGSFFEIIVEDTYKSLVYHIQYNVISHKGSWIPIPNESVYEFRKAISERYQHNEVISLLHKYD